MQRPTYLRRTSLRALLVLASLAIAGSGNPVVHAQAGGDAAAMPGDFNGDGFADLAVGVPFEDEDNVGSTGAVNVIYGSADGLTSAGDQYLTSVTFGYDYHTDDRFGAALAVGDFNRDGYSDLAIGMPNRVAFGVDDSGVVLLIDGSPTGLDTSTARALTTIGPARRGRIGAGLVSADFNGDGFADLAVGILDMEYGFVLSFTGSVHIFYGGNNSLTVLGAQEFNRRGSVHLGAPMAAGDFNNDGAADLALGEPLRNFEAGAVTLLRGSLDGLLLERPQVLDQNTPGVPDSAESGDRFGYALATGDFNGDGRDDLAVGVPGEDMLSNTAVDAGAVHVFFGSALDNQLVGEGGMFFGQGTLPGVAIEANDAMGRALAAGKFNDGRWEDLAIGVPGEDIGDIGGAGMVTVMYGSPSGPSFTVVQHWHQNVAGVPDEAEWGDEFGRALTALNFGRGDNDDLAIGVPFENLVSTITGTSQTNAGAVNVIYGSIGGLTPLGVDFWHQDRPGIASAAATDDRFGVTLP
jgi:hypothetical protein